MKFEFHPAAREEYLEAIDFYESRSEGLGQAFAVEVETSVRETCADPERNRILDKDIRRKLIHRFPYGILYSIENSSVLIIAVMHCSRMPGYWKDRLEG